MGVLTTSRHFDVVHVNLSHLQLFWDDKLFYKKLRNKHAKMTSPAKYLFHRACNTLYLTSPLLSCLPAVSCLEFHRL